MGSAKERLISRQARDEALQLANAMSAYGRHGRWPQEGELRQIALRLAVDVRRLARHVDASEELRWREEARR